MRQEDNFNSVERFGLSASYVRCDKGIEEKYCSFKLVNLTEADCFAECLNLNSRYFGTMEE